MKMYESKHFPQSTFWLVAYQQVLKITFKLEMFADDSSNIYGANRSPFHINFVMHC